MIKGDKIKWLRKTDPEEPEPGEVGTVTRTHPATAMFLTEWPDGSVMIADTHDENDLWERA